MRRFIALSLVTVSLLQVAPLTAAGAGRAAGAQVVTTGVINGTARSATGQALSNTTVQLRNLQTGQLAGTTTSNATGGFSFAGLNPANYVIEIVNPAGAIVGTSAPIAVAAGATVGATVAATAAAAAAGAGAAGVSTALIVASVAAAAGVTGLVVVASQDDESPAR